MTNQVFNSQDNVTPTTKTNAARWKLFLVLGICAAPLVLSYLTYYVIKPTSRTNYGTLLDPRNYPMPQLNGVLLGGQAQELSAFKGKWILLQTSHSACLEVCQKNLFNMRQLRLMQGKEMDRIERVVLLTDNEPVDTTLLRQFDGVHFLRVAAKAVQTWLPAEDSGSTQDRLYLIDPLGNLMMRYNVDADPMKVHKDIVKLLKASSIG